MSRRNALANPHTKSNLCCKRIVQQKAILAVCKATNKIPRELVVLDVCSSDAKDLHGLVMCGVDPQKYIGVDSDAQAILKLNNSDRDGRGRVFHVDFNKLLEFKKVMKEELRLLGRDKVDVVICNFAVHLLTDKVKTLIDHVDEYCHDRTAIQLSIIDGDKLQQYMTTGSGPITISFKGLAEYNLQRVGPWGALQLIPTIYKDNGGTGAFANNGSPEAVVSVADIQEACVGKRWRILVGTPGLNHAELMSPHASACGLSEEVMRFLELHSSFILYKL